MGPAAASIVATPGRKLAAFAAVLLASLGAGLGLGALTHGEADRRPTAPSMDSEMEPTERHP